MADIFAPQLLRDTTVNVSNHCNDFNTNGLGKLSKKIVPTNSSRILSISPHHAKSFHHNKALIDDFVA